MILKKLHKSQSGMSILELLLLLLLILILILLGWYVWSQKDKNESESSSSTPAKTEQKKEEPAKEEQAKYLEIKEWGVKVKLSDDIKDAYYDNNISTDMQAFSLRVKALDSEADCKTGAQSVAAIFKVKKDEIDPQFQDEGKKYSETQKGVTIGDSFYFTGVAQYYCTENAAKKAVLDKVRIAFTNATTQIEKL